MSAQENSQAATKQIATPLTAAMETAARAAGLVVLSVTAGADFHGAPTARFNFGLTPDAPAERTMHLELSHEFDFHKPSLLPEMTVYLREAALRLRNPRPDCYVTLSGIPIRYAEFAWPFHRSTTGGDTYVVHGSVHLEDGSGNPLFAKIAASMTVTFAEIVPAAEQPYAETFIYNAVRKTLDQGQLELIKSGNRQPVPVTTRYYSLWHKKFSFTDTNEESRAEFLVRKIYWLSGVLGGSQPIWVADPRDAQYLNTEAEHLQQMAAGLASDGLAQLSDKGQFAAATPKLLERAERYHEVLAKALAETKPQFNEEMRHGHTNM